MASVVAATTVCI